MKNKDYNYTYRGADIIIRSNVGIARFQRKELKRIEGLPNEKIKAELESYLSEFFHESLKGIIPDKNLLGGLMQISSSFGSELIHQLCAYETKWCQPAFVRIGLTGTISSGKPGQPNYQIESKDESEKLTFYFSHKLFDADSFDEGNVTNKLSKDDIKAIWHLHEHQINE